MAVVYILIPLIMVVTVIGICIYISAINHAEHHSGKDNPQIPLEKINDKPSGSKARQG